ncbi:deubiquitinase OTUD6B-like [Phymastichus coffea]|uniref:deubiquitinase OTUD6B-like n=1 Tax=Phymastichus coffea TaxID=108790 RepID=UPI00273BC676|nr:deubiquitinase OTUD6B-like [Phymastichus coffea]
MIERSRVRELGLRDQEFVGWNYNPDSDDLMSIEQYEKYCDSVGETSAWGGTVELQVLANILKCPIEVIQASGVPYIVGEEYEQTRKLILTYHRHMYQLGAHYNSVTKYIANLEDS